MSRPSTHALFGKDDSILSVLPSFMAKRDNINKAQNRPTADIPCYSWLKMGKGLVILIILSLMAFCKTVPLKSSTSAYSFQQGNKFCLKFNWFSKNNSVRRKPYLIFKNRIHISYTLRTVLSQSFWTFKIYFRNHISFVEAFYSLETIPYNFFSLLSAQNALTALIIWELNFWKYL